MNGRASQISDLCLGPLNQALILGKTSLATKSDKSSKFSSAQISLTSSLLKTLSPAGKKLTPMLAISAQGFLFNLGTILFGINPFGIWIGTILLSLWGFIQPISIYMLLFGENLLYMANYFFKKFSVFSSITIDDVWVYLIIVVSIKITIATLVTVLIFAIEKEDYIRWQNKLIKKSATKKKNLNSQFESLPLKENIKKALSDLFNPFFIFTWIFTGLFFYFAKSPHASFIWILCRPLIVGFILFLGIRLLPFDFLFKKLDDWGFKNFAKILQSSIDKLKKL